MGMVHTQITSFLFRLHRVHPLLEAFLCPRTTISEVSIKLLSQNTLSYVKHLGTYLEVYLCGVISRLLYLAAILEVLVCPCIVKLETMGFFYELVISLVNVSCRHHYFPLRSRLHTQLTSQ